MELYKAIIDVANTMNCSFDKAFMWCTFALMVFFALIGWSISFCVEYGINLYELTKIVFRFIRKNVVKLFHWFRCRRFPW